MKGVPKSSPTSIRTPARFASGMMRQVCSKAARQPAQRACLGLRGAVGEAVADREGPRRVVPALCEAEIAHAPEHARADEALRLEERLDALGVHAVGVVDDVDAGAGADQDGLARGAV